MSKQIDNTPGSALQAKRITPRISGERCQFLPRSKGETGWGQPVRKS